MKEYSIKITGGTVSAGELVTSDCSMVPMSIASQDTGITIIASRGSAEWLSKHLNRGIVWSGQRKVNHAGLAGSISTPKKARAVRINGDLGGMKSPVGQRGVRALPNGKFRVVHRRSYVGTFDTLHEAAAAWEAKETSGSNPQSTNRPRKAKSARIIQMPTKGQPRKKHLSEEERKIVQFVLRDNEEKNLKTVPDYVLSLGEHYRKLITNLTQRGLLWRHRKKYVTITEIGKDALNDNQV